MTTFVFPSLAEPIERLVAQEPVEKVRRVDEHVAMAVRRGLGSQPKRLPPWLFYDRTGSRLFDEITERPEYYLTRTERSILSDHAGAIINRAAQGARLRITELGAGSAGKTRLLLKAALEQQGSVTYEPLDVSASALEAARHGIESEMDGVCVTPCVMDYTHENKSGLKHRLVRGANRIRGIEFGSTNDGERRLVLYIGSSIGNFEPEEAYRLLRRVRAGLRPGDGLLLGVDLVKDVPTLLAAYDDFAGVTADFNLNMLARLNRELGAEFPLDSFEHRAVWNEEKSRIEMHLASRTVQSIPIAALNMEVDFAEGETIHTENSYKYAAEQAEAMMSDAGFVHTESWTDERGWFRVCLGRAA